MQITPIIRTRPVSDPKGCPYCKTRQGAFRCPSCNRVALGRVAEDLFSDEDIKGLMDFWFPDLT